ncbi:MAG: endonuclease/exonuclease/phosphatase family protein, partial [Myxococcota bacterium]|nr:endonuclease/exonuclease/phosphatase family protein [Myxococcota bacterium]
WDAPEVPEEDRWATRQVDALVAAMDGDGRALILCGDFNVTPDDPVLSRLARAGFRDAHRDLARGPTCCANGRTQVMDYLCHGPGLVAAPGEVADLRGVTSLPSHAHPSDHLPVLARFEPRPG